VLEQTFSKQSSQLLTLLRRLLEKNLAQSKASMQTVQKALVAGVANVASAVSPSASPSASSPASAPASAASSEEAPHVHFLTSLQKHMLAWVATSLQLQAKYNDKFKAREKGICPSFFALSCDRVRLFDVDVSLHTPICIR
jgi:hypothetical protein